MAKKKKKKRPNKKVKLLLGSAVFVVYADYTQQEGECITVCSSVMDNLINCMKWKTDVTLLDFNHRRWGRGKVHGKIDGVSPH